jgi:hypothetical protein
MSIIAIPITFVDTNVLTANQLNSNFQAIFNEFNGNITDANIKPGAGIAGSKLAAAGVTGTQLANAAVADAKLDYTSVKVLRIGPTFPGSGNGLRIARGSKAAIFAAGVSLTTITFSTDSIDGNPNFAVAPIVVAIVKRTNGANTYSCFQGVAPTTTTVRIDCVSSAGADATTQAIEWYAIGEA